MKRNHSIFCALALAACCFLAGCANGETTTQTPPQEPTSTTDTQTTKVSYQLPTVHYLSDLSSIANTVLPLLKTMYGADIDGCSISTTLQQPELETENKTFAFTMTDGTLYLADVDSENKQVVAIETVAPKSDIPSDAAKQTDYIASAEAFAEKYLQAAGLQEAVCYQPVQPIRGEVTTNSVYVVFPEMQTYVEVSADEGHALVGYRHFADEQALNDFLQRQGKAF